MVATKIRETVRNGQKAYRDAINIAAGAHSVWQQPDPHRRRERAAVTLEKEDMTIVATSNPSKNAVHQRFYTRNAFSGLAVEGLEPPTRGL